MLSNQPVTNLFFTYRDKGPHETLKIAKDNEVELNKFGVLDPRTGLICGCAVYYKTPQGDEIIYATSFYSSHGDMNICDIKRDEINISLTDDENTVYGFITDTGYFLNRELAKKSYRFFCLLNNFEMKKPEMEKLYSYDVNWGLLAKYKNDYRI